MHILEDQTGARSHGPLQSRGVAAAAMAAALVLSAVAVFVVQQGAQAQTACDKYAATSGSDSNDGSYSHPYATPQKLSDSLSAGQRGCFFEGTYQQSSNNWQVSHGGTWGSPITLQSVPGQKATFLGRLYITDAANFVTVRDMVLDGSASPTDTNCTTLDGGCGLLPSPTVNGDYVQFIGNEVTNQHTGICFVLGSHSSGIAYSTLIQNNHIHGCGRLPSMNHDHGIYVEAAWNTSIIGNWIYDNADRGIQLYPDAQGSVIQSNVIDGNGEGIIFAGDGIYASSFNEVKNNTISNSQVRWLVEEYWPTPYRVGYGNTVHDNCVWPTNPNSYYNQNNGIMPNAMGFIAYNNIKADPMYANAGTGSPGCGAVYSGP